MKTIERSVKVNVPIRTAYNQWTQFEEFPRFMDGVESVAQVTDSELHWVAEIGGRRKEWDARITEQVPDQAIAWEGFGSPDNFGRVFFEPAEGGERTKVSVAVQYQPEDAVEKVGDALGMVERRVENDLERFKTFIEQRGTETGAWRGEIHEPPTG